MARRNPRCGFLIAGQGRLAVALLCLVVCNPLRAQDADALPAAAALPQPADLPVSAPVTAGDPATMLGQWDTGLADAVFFKEGFQGDSATAPAQELAAGLDVQVEQKRRKFRARAVDWMADRSVTMGRMTDLLLGGAETGWHVVVDPSGTEEYILEWKAKFR